MPPEDYETVGVRAAVGGGTIERRRLLPGGIARVVGGTVTQHDGHNVMSMLDYDGRRRAWRVEGAYEWDEFVPAAAVPAAIQSAEKAVGGIEPWRQAKQDADDWRVRREESPEYALRRSARRGGRPED